MLEKLTHLLLKEISEICGDGGYKIVETEELLACFKDEPVPRKALDGMLTYLRENGYIDVRYAEGDLYCLTLLPLGRVYAERERAVRTENKRKYFCVFLMTALGALLGGFLGALFASFVGGMA